MNLLYKLIKNGIIILLQVLFQLENVKMVASEYVNNAPNYVVKTNQSFINQLVSALTFGISYTNSNEIITFL